MGPSLSERPGSTGGATNKQRKSEVYGESLQHCSQTAGARKGTTYDRKAKSQKTLGMMNNVVRPNKSCE
jgi:hypothetical protein